MINWQEHMFNKPVPCKISIRPEVNGRQAKPELMALNGVILELTPLWFMRDDESYPGEWAVGEPSAIAANGTLRSAGIGWIASGDVIPQVDDGKDGE